MLSWSPRRVALAALVLLVAGGGGAAALALSSPPADAHPGRPPWWWRPQAVPASKPKPGAPSTPTPPSAATPASTATPAGSAAPAAGTATPAVPATPATPATPVVPAAAAAPAVGVSVAVARVAGTVVVRAPGGPAAVLDEAGATLPTGTRVDTRHGSVALTSAIDAAGTTQTGRFSGGVFEVRQRPGGRGITELVLVGGHWGSCPRRARTASAARAVASRRRKPIRRLWGSDDHGRFQTRGGGSVATVRGTRWLTEDFCAGTRTTVVQGAVAVRSRRTGRTVVVRAGHSRFVSR